jgi:hypothetical protein
MVIATKIIDDLLKILQDGMIKLSDSEMLVVNVRKKPSYWKSNVMLFETYKASIKKQKYIKRMKKLELIHESTGKAIEGVKKNIEKAEDDIKKTSTEDLSNDKHFIIEEEQEHKQRIILFNKIIQENNKFSQENQIINSKYKRLEEINEVNRSQFQQQVEQVKRLRNEIIEIKRTDQGNIKMNQILSNAQSLLVYDDHPNMNDSPRLVLNNLISRLGHQVNELNQQLSKSKLVELSSETRISQLLAKIESIKNAQSTSFPSGMDKSQVSTTVELELKDLNKGLKKPLTLIELIQKYKNIQLNLNEAIKVINPIFKKFKFVVESKGFINSLVQFIKYLIENFQLNSF